MKKNIFIDKILNEFIKGIEIECFLYNLDEVVYSKIENLKTKIKMNNNKNKIEIFKNYINLFNKYLFISCQFIYLENLENGKKYLGKAKILFDCLIKHKKNSYFDINHYKLKMLLNDIIYFTHLKNYKISYNLIIQNIELINNKINNRKGFIVNLRLLFYCVIIFIINNNIDLAYEYLIKLENLYEIQLNDKINKKKFFIGIIVICKTRKYNEIKKRTIYGILTGSYLLYDYFKHHYKKKCSLNRINIIKKILNNLITSNKIENGLQIYQKEICFKININQNIKKEYNLNLIKNEIKKTDKSISLENKKIENFYKKKIFILNRKNNIKSNRNINYNKSALFIPGNKVIKNEYIYNYLVSNRKNTKNSYSKPNINLIKELDKDNKKETNNIFLLDNKTKSKFNFKLRNLSHRTKKNITTNKNKINFNKINKINKIIKNKISTQRNFFKVVDKNDKQYWFNRRPIKKKKFKKKKILNKKYTDKKTIKQGVAIVNEDKNNDGFKEKPEHNVSKNSNKGINKDHNHTHIKQTNSINSRRKKPKNNDKEIVINLGDFFDSIEKEIKNSSSIKEQENNINNNKYKELKFFIFIENINLVMKKKITKFISISFNKIISYNILKNTNRKSTSKNLEKIESIPIFINNNVFFVQGMFSFNSINNKIFIGDLNLKIIRNKDKINFYIIFNSKPLSFNLNFLLEEIEEQKFINSEYFINLVKKFFKNRIRNMNLKLNFIHFKMYNIFGLNIDSYNWIEKILNLFYNYLIENYLIINSKIGYKLIDKNFKQTNKEKIIENKFKILLLNKINKNQLIEVENDKINVLTIKNIIFNKNKKINKNYKKIKFNVINYNNNLINCDHIFYFKIIDKINNYFLIYYIIKNDNKFKVEVNFINNYLYKENYEIIINFPNNLSFYGKLKYLKLEIRKLILVDKLKFKLNEKASKSNFNKKKNSSLYYDIRNYKTRSINKKDFKFDSYYYNMYEYKNKKLQIKIYFKNEELIIDLYNFENQEKLIEKVTNFSTYYQIYNIIINKKFQNITFIKFFFSIKRVIFGNIIEYKKNKVQDCKIISNSNNNYIKFNILNNIDNSYLKQKFLNIQFFFINYINNIGNCYIKVTITHSYFSIGIDKMGWVKFEISPKLLKIKNYIIIFNCNDWRHIFNIELKENIKNTEKLIKIFQNITKKLVLKENKTYSNLLFPYNKNIDIKEKVSISYQNYFNKFDLFKKKSVYNKYLNKNIKETKIILKKIKKINNMYIIVIIEKHIIINNQFSITIYIPFNRRKFHCNITKNDFDYWEEKFSDEIFHYSKRLEYKKMQKNYSSFKEFFDNIKNNECKNYRPYKTKTKRKNFIKIWTWELIIKNMNIKIKDNNYILNINNFNGILKEILDKKIIFIKDKIFTWVEIYFHNFNEKINLNDNFKNLSIDNLENYHILVRFLALNKNHLNFNHKLNLKEIFELYKDKLLNKINYNDKDFNENFNLKLLKDWSYLIIKKIKKIMKKNEINKYIEYNKKIIFGNEFKIKMNINSSINLNIRKREEYLKENNILLFKKVFSLNQPKVFNILYNEKYKKIKIFINNILNKKIYKKIINEDIICSKIPFFKFKLEMKLFKKLGEIIYLQYKNEILLDYVLNN